MKWAKVPWCRSMQGFIRRKNIENYSRQLAGLELDEAQRKYLTGLLADEVAKAPRPRPADDVDQRVP